MTDLQKITSKRKNELSYLNILFCLLVIFIHVTSNPIATLNKTSWQYAVVFFPWRLSAFVVQGFLFLSGLKLFLNHPNGFHYKSLYVSRLKRIFIPYILWVVAYYIYFVRKNYFGFDVNDLLVYICNGTLVSPFYYVIILFQFYILAPLWRRMVCAVSPIFMLVFSTVITILLGQNLPQILAMLNCDFIFQYNDRIFTTYLIYWVAGCYAGANYDLFKMALRKNRVFLTVIFVICTALNASFSFISFSGIQYVPWLETIHFCYCISAILFFFSISLAVAEQGRPMCRLLSGIDKASYSIFLFHCFVINIVNDCMTYFHITNVAATYLLRMITVFPITITLCLAWNRLCALIQSRTRTK